jgi:hypothetical protein
MATITPVQPPDYWQSWEQFFANAIQRTARAAYQSRLASADARVRAHEAAHVAAAGPYATSGPQYQRVIGPGGRAYAVGGHVSVDLEPVPGNPEATLRKARALQRAAFAPGQPSSADMRVAAEAYRLEQEAQQEIRERREERSEGPAWAPEAVEDADSEGSGAEPPANPFDPPLYA